MTIISILGYPTQQLMTLLTPSQGSLPTASLGTVSLHPHKAQSPYTLTRHTLPTPSQDTLSLHPHTGMAHYTIHYGCDHLCSIMAHLAKHQYTLRQASFEWCIGYTAPHHILTPRLTTPQLTTPHLTLPRHSSHHITIHVHTHVLFVPKGSLRVRVLGVSEYQTRRTPREAH